MSDVISIRPMPTKFGIGFTSENKLPDDFIRGYRYEQIGRYHNYHVTSQRLDWPESYPIDYKRIVIDGFSPNLNKKLHVGHLRNLAIACALSRILYRHNAKFVALLGASLGVKKAALRGWRFWTKFVGYEPQKYYDIVLPQDVIKTRQPTAEETALIIEGNEGYSSSLPEYWDGPNGPIVIKRSNGKPLYAFYDLVFAKEVGPTHYITGHEQREHFANLGLESKHLPMGLVLGPDGKKLKSRDGTALLATDALKLVSEQLRDAPKDIGYKLAWNILTWNFLHAARETDLKFDVEKWVRPEAPGMYITYTRSRVEQALQLSHLPPHNQSDFTENDVKLMGFANSCNYYFHKAIVGMDPAPIANFTHDLARMITMAYERETIRGGRPAFIAAMYLAQTVLDKCMVRSGMFLLDRV